MIGFSDTNFLREYIKRDKLEDNFQTGKQKLLPFTLNPISGSVYDGTCGLNGVAGEFYRIKTQSNVEPIFSPQDTEETLRKELDSKFKMPADDIERFIKVFNDVIAKCDRSLILLVRSNEVFRQGTRKGQESQQIQERTAKDCRLLRIHCRKHAGAV